MAIGHGPGRHIMDEFMVHEPLRSHMQHPGTLLNISEMTNLVLGMFALANIDPFPSHIAMPYHEWLMLMVRHPATLLQGGLKILSHVDVAQNYGSQVLQVPAGEFLRR